jgi:phospholipid-binding lipoprotein MlaA
MFGLLLMGLVDAVIPNTVHASEPMLIKPQHVMLAAKTDDDYVNDPLETINRGIFEFNEVLHESVLGPVADAYKNNVPQTLRLGIGNFLTNLSSPVTFANTLLQGNVLGAFDILMRFLINSSIGIGGIADVVSEVDGEPRKEDFGQTMGLWGVGEGFYLVLPVFGPSNPRDLLGKFFVDPYLDPFGQAVGDTKGNATAYSKKAASGIDEFSGVVDELRQIRKTSVDYYAAIRSLYRQKRNSEISNGSGFDLPPIPNLGYDLSPEDFEQPLAGTPKSR